jgi:hypothetical protein
MAIVKKPSLVPDWRDCWRWFCMHAMFIAIALQGAWLELPDDMRAGLPDWFVHAVTVAILLLGMIGRVIEQARARAAPPEPPQ